MFHCTLGDVLIATFTFCATAALMRSWNWPVQALWRGGLLMVATGIIYTGFSEWYHVYRLANWAYASRMPLLAGMGLTLLLQWLLIPSQMLVMVHWRWARQHS